MGKSEVWLDAFALMNSRPVIRLAVQKKEDATIPSGSALPARLPPRLRPLPAHSAVDRSLHVRNIVSARVATASEYSGYRRCSSGGQSSGPVAELHRYQTARG